jgi:diaminopimelate epimerase
MSALANRTFVKMNGIGNEIVVLDLRADPVPVSSGDARALSRPAAVPFDQLMVLYPPKEADTEAFVRIFNSDGSEAGACGNGMRCIAALAASSNGKTNLTFETTSGIIL